MLDFLVKYHAMFRDLATGLGALVAIGIGFMGLSTWKRQLRGNADHELARRMLLAALKARTAMASLRSGFIHGSETAAAIKSAGVSLEGLSETQSSAASMRAVYSMRWQPLDEATRELRVACLEAEAVWGEPGPKEAYEAVNRCVRRLWADLIMFLDTYGKSEHLPPELNKRYIRSLTSAPLFDDEPDELAEAMDVAVSKIEAVSRPHLIRSRGRSSR